MILVPLLTHNAFVREMNKVKFRWYKTCVIVVSTAWKIFNHKLCTFYCKCILDGTATVMCVSTMQTLSRNPSLFFSVVVVVVSIILHIFFSLYRRTDRIKGKRSKGHCILNGPSFCIPITLSFMISPNNKNNSHISNSGFLQLCIKWFFDN